MGRRAYTVIENPTAYHNAVQSRIRARANAKRARQWETDHPELAAWAAWMPENEYDDTGRLVKADRHPWGYFPTFARKALNEWGAPTPKATETLYRILADRKARAANREAQIARDKETAQAWEPGRQQVEGTILTIKEYESSFGYRQTLTYKMLVRRDDGSKIFCTVPSGIDGTADELRGARVRFTVKVQPKDDEPTFAFGSRPTKGERLAPQEG